jgi:hypothetical protein
MHRNSAFTLTVHASNVNLIAFNAENWDYGGNADTSTGRYTVPENCQLFVNARTSIATSAAGDRFICMIHVNATERARGHDRIGSGSRMDLGASAVVSVVAGDVIDFRIHQISGTGRALDIGADYLTYMTISRA